MIYLLGLILVTVIVIGASSWLLLNKVADLLQESINQSQSIAEQKSKENKDLYLLIAKGGKGSGVEELDSGDHTREEILTELETQNKASFFA